MAEKATPGNFGQYIDRNYRLIRLSFLQAFRELGVDLTTEQWVLLDNLYQQDGLSQNELAQRCFKNAPTISRIIDLLCQKGFTERRRVETDRRSYHIFLTATGNALYEKVKPAVLQLRQQGWQQLTDEDYEHFLRIMNQVFENFGGLE